MKKYLFMLFCVLIMAHGADSSTISFKDIKLDDDTKKLVEDIRKSVEGTKGFENIENKIGKDNYYKLIRRLFCLMPYANILNLSNLEKVEKDLDEEKEKISNNCNSFDDMLDWIVKDGYVTKVVEVKGWANNLCWKNKPILKDEKENKKLCDTIGKKPLEEVFKDYPEAKEKRDAHFKKMDANICKGEIKQ